MNKTAIDRLAWTVSQSQHVVVMSGAGLSVSSGIPTFRDRMKALWSQFDPMEVASLSGFKASPDKVWHWLSATAVLEPVRDRRIGAT